MLRLRLLPAVLLLCLFHPRASLAQSAFNIGYGAGFFTHAQHNMEVFAFAENEINHAYWDDKINVNRFVHGPEFGFSRSFSDGEIFMYWTNRHAVYSGGGVNPATGYKEHFSYKLRLVRLSFGGMYGKDIRIGASLDLGRFRPFWNFDLGGTTKSDGYELVFGKNRGVFSQYLSMGSSIMLQFMSTKLIVPRIVWYADWFGSDLHRANGEDFYFRSGCISLELLVRLGKK